MTKPIDFSDIVAALAEATSDETTAIALVINDGDTVRVRTFGEKTEIAEAIAMTKDALGGR